MGIQLWYADGSALSETNAAGTFNGTQAFCDQGVVLAFDLPLGTNVYSDNSALDSSKLILGSCGEETSSNVECSLLQQRQLPAHVGGAREPAPIVIEGLDGVLGGLQSQAGGTATAVALAAR